MSDLRLMIPGPVDAEEAVLSALGEPTLPHYGVEWMPLFRETTDMLKRLFETENDVLIMPGPGTAALDAAIGSLVPAGSSVCIPVNGFFGMRLRQVAEGYGLAVSSLDFPEGTHIDPDEVRRHLKDSIPRSQADGQ
ncbi:MAG TPA: alanine--glyoxylate aminotransferase family protein, partial [Chloroflexi bacterium]|nr:alanine--glyoxylate aminotransferase family protein [Chloroflexota bacterium]